MSNFFEARLNGYHEHTLTNIQSTDMFYPFTAKQPLLTEYRAVLDLGCGTWPKLEAYSIFNPSARITTIDLSQ